MKSILENMYMNLSGDHLDESLLIKSINWAYGLKQAESKVIG